MNMPRQSRIVHHRYTSMLLVVSCLLGTVLLTGCWINNEEEDAEQRKSYALQYEQQTANRDGLGAGQKKAAEATTMKYEDDAVQLEGKWTWPSLKTDYRESPDHPRIYPTERVGEGWTFTIVKKGSGYTTISGGTVTLKGTSVTITEKSGGEGDSISLTGEVKGDTIVGTVHRSVVAKTLSSGVPQGAGEYDGPWTATRVK